MTNRPSVETKGLKIIRPKKSGIYRFLYDGVDVTNEWMGFFSYMSEWQEEDCERLFSVHKEMEKQVLSTQQAQMRDKIKKLPHFLGAYNLSKDEAISKNDVLAIIEGK
jgi:hypothetical protein